MLQRKLFEAIEPYTRNAYLVESGSRAGIKHLVDLEGFERQKIVCTCEDFLYNGNVWCAHIISVMMQV